ncbi:MAG TPA: hypothetical protein VGO62_21725 [Myxococcota bacterium]|jgi:hypothetical protein
MSDQPAPVAIATPANDLPLEPIVSGYIPEQFAKSCDPASPPPMRMMAARAMAPIPPKNLVPIIYQLMMDPDPKIAAAAEKSFRGLDDKLLGPIVGDVNVPPQLLSALCHTLVHNFTIVEKLLLNKSTPDAGFVFVAGHATEEKIFNLVVENQERLLRTHNIVRALSKNNKCLRSELDRAIDFLVREGVFLDDVDEFEDSFLRLGKNEMLEALKKVKISRDDLTAKQQAQMDARGLAPDQIVFGDESEASEETLDAIAEDKNPEHAHDDVGGSLFAYRLPVQIKLAMTGSHSRAIEALTSANRMVAGAGIRNPKVKDNDVVKLSRSRSMHEDVIRFICNNGDWTKSYAVKLNLVQNPKTPTPLVLRWLPLLRQTDLKALSRSKQIPSQVAIMAKRLMDRGKA